MGDVLTLLIHSGHPAYDQIVWGLNPKGPDPSHEYSGWQVRRRRNRDGDRGSTALMDLRKGRSSFWESPFTGLSPWKLAHSGTVRVCHSRLVGTLIRRMPGDGHRPNARDDEHDPHEYTC